MTNQTKTAFIFILMLMLSACKLLGFHKEESMEHPLQAAKQNIPAPVDDPNWQPNEGFLVRAGDLLMQQQRELGRIANNAQKRDYLCHSMNITQRQADMILDELGIY